MHYLLDLNFLITIGAFINGGVAAVIARRSDAKVQKELSPNHGGSVKDKLDLVLEIVKTHSGQIEAIERGSDFTHRQLAEENRQLAAEIRRLAECHKNQPPQIGSTSSSNN